MFMGEWGLLAAAAGGRQYDRKGEASGF